MARLPQPTQFGEVRRSAGKIDQGCHRHRHRVGPAQIELRSNRIEQHIEIEGFEHKAVMRGAAIGTGGIFMGVGRYHQDRQPPRRISDPGVAGNGAQPIGDPPARQARHLDIQQHEIGCAAQRHFDPRRTIAGGKNGKAKRSQQALQHSELCRIIVDGQDSTPWPGIADDRASPHRCCRGFGRLHQHQPQHEAAADARRTDDIDVTPHDPGQRAGNGEAEAGSGLGPRLCRTAAFERFENACQFFGVEPDAGIRNAEFGDHSGMPHRQRDRPRFGIFDGVRQQVNQQLAQPFFIDADIGRQVSRRLPDKGQLLCRRLAAKHIGKRFKERRQRHQIGAELHLSGFDPRNVEQSVDNVDEVLRRPTDHPRRFDRIDLPVAFKQLRIAMDGIERRPDFMADTDKIATLGQIGRFGDFACRQ